MLDAESNSNVTYVAGANCRDFCFPWRSTYASPDVGRTLLVANLGAHYADAESYRRDFDDFVRAMGEIGRSNDIVWFRTTVPGHTNCSREDAVPYRNYSAYRSAEADALALPFSWDKFELYNDYASGVIEQLRWQQRHLRSTGGGKDSSSLFAVPAIGLLDIFPFAVLRPDGHLAGSDCRGCWEKSCARCRVDCLHYSFPGPLDWWNHFLYSQLIDAVLFL